MHYNHNYRHMNNSKTCTTPTHTNHYANTHACAHTCTHTHTHTCTHTHAHTCTRAHTHIHIRAHTHTHTHLSRVASHNLHSGALDGDLPEAAGLIHHVQDLPLVKHTYLAVRCPHGKVKVHRSHRLFGFLRFRLTVGRIPLLGGRGGRGGGGRGRKGGREGGG